MLCVFFFKKSFFENMVPCFQKNFLQFEVGKNCVVLIVVLVLCCLQETKTKKNACKKTNKYNDRENTAQTYDALVGHSV